MASLLLFVSVLSCAPPTDGHRTASALAERLQAGGLRVALVEEIEQPFFTARARVYRVEGDDLQVYQYPGAAAAQRDAARVSPDGSIGGSMPHWIAAPHFFRRENLVVLYLGSNARVIDALRGELGPQFAGQ